MEFIYYIFIPILLVPILIFLYIIISYLITQVSMLTRKSINKPLKMVVFDLDETLGYFTELGLFWDALENFYGTNLFIDKFIEAVDIFPEFFRPNIFKILDFIHKKQVKKTLYKLIIYTNNQGPKSWVNMISEYMNHKLGYKVFDQIIGAYKVNGKQIEPNRTSHDKSLTDLIRCCKSPPNIEVCFIDDLYHPLMDKDNVYYINIKPYRFSMPLEEMATRYYDKVLKSVKSVSKDDFINHMVTYMKRYNYMVFKKNETEEKTDIIVGKKLLSHLEDFLARKRIVNTRKKKFNPNKSKNTNK